MEKTPQSHSPIKLLANAQDRFGVIRDLGISTLTYKVAGSDSSELFIAENLMHAKGGPPRHIHLLQDEWFFIRQGEFILEVGGERFMGKPGDSYWGPRGVPHQWAYTGGTGGSILFIFNPPGKMEAFFQELANLTSMAPTDREFWRKYEMELVGPPLQV